LTALAAVGGCLWVVREHRRDPHPFDGDGFAAFVLLGLFALVALVAGLGQAGGSWAAAGLWAVNGVVQPFCLYMLAMAAYKVGMGLAGRAVYAGRVLPRGECDPEKYRSLRRYCVSQGIVGLVFTSWLSWFCLKRLL
jgi:hypothetical protein